MPSQAHRQKNFAGRFRLPPQPNDAMQNHSMLRPDYRSVLFLDNKCTFGKLRSDQKWQRNLQNAESGKEIK